MLRKHPITSDFVVDLVDLIEFDLLRLHVNQRASSADIVTKLKNIQTSCASDEQYCVRKIAEDTSRISVNSLDDETSLSFTEQTKSKGVRDLGASLFPLSPDNTGQNAKDNRTGVSSWLRRFQRNKNSK
jgi:hypothetical protein